MAGFAFLAIAAGMLVLDGMAGITGHTHALVFLAGMAGRARYVAVGAGQGELGFGVVERRGAAPVFFVVARFAGRA